jgi:pimeloyl-ACP methyl ester carboxylesterase
MQLAQPLGCLLLHGLGGGPYELGRLPEALREAGLLVNAPTLPGHEGPGPRMPDSRWEDWLETVHRAYEELVTSVGRPAVVLGFSTGGTLGLRLALEARLAGLVLLAPFMAIRYSGLVPLRPVSYVRRLARLVSGLERVLFALALRRAVDRDRRLVPQGADGGPARAHAARGVLFDGRRNLQNRGRALLPIRRVGLSRRGRDHRPDPGRDDLAGVAGIGTMGDRIVSGNQPRIPRRQLDRSRASAAYATQAGDGMTSATRHDHETLEEAVNTNRVSWRGSMNWSDSALKRSKCFRHCSR